MAGVLVLNSGSSSIKFALFDEDLRETLNGRAVEIGGVSRLELAGRGRDIALADHLAALDAIFASVSDHGIALTSLRAVAHRVVHGGASLTAPCRVTPQVISAIRDCVPLAPLHNPHNLAGIEAVRALAPELAQVACFDTAFHSTNPDVARRYALPAGLDARGLRRYGFHGISYASLVHAIGERPDLAAPERLLALHLGNGASLCAIKAGQSVATTMGYSPLEGLTMGTRCGSIDANLVLRLAAEEGIDRASEILNKQSGLVGLAGQSDMRSLQESDTAEARFAIAHFCYWAVRHAGSMIAAMGGLDAIAFTGGIGENDADVRARIVSGLAYMGGSLDAEANGANRPRIEAADSHIPVLIVPAEEERRIARDAFEVL